MVRINLEELTRDVNSSRQTRENLFTYHVSNRRYGAAAQAGFGHTDYTSLMALATARTTFNAEMSNERIRPVLLQGYLPVYSQEINQRRWAWGRNVAIGMAGAGLALVVSSMFADTETTKKAERIVAGIFEVGAAVKVARDFVLYRLMPSN